MSNLFDDADIVFRYTRQEALEDGVLIDLSDTAKEAGFRFPLAVTQGVFAILNNTDAPGQDLKGRSWDMLMIFRKYARRTNGNVIRFAPLFLMPDSKKPKPVQMWAKCGPGDDAEPVITIMLEGED